MKENIVAVKAFDFALKSIELYKYLVNEKKEYILSKQFLRAATSIGANIEESVGGQSKRDFFMKITISYKEARECHYWIKLLIESNFLEQQTANELLDQCEELERILGSIIKTLRQKLSQNNANS